MYVLIISWSLNCLGIFFDLKWNKRWIYSLNLGFCLFVVACQGFLLCESFKLQIQEEFANLYVVSLWPIKLGNQTLLIDISNGIPQFIIDYGIFFFLSLAIYFGLRILNLRSIHVQGSKEQKAKKPHEILDVRDIEPKLLLE